MIKQRARTIIVGYKLSQHDTIFEMLRNANMITELLQIQTSTYVQHMLNGRWSVEAIERYIDKHFSKCYNVEWSYMI